MMEVPKCNLKDLDEHLFKVAESAIGRSFITHTDDILLDDMDLDSHFSVDPPTAALLQRRTTVAGLVIQLSSQSEDASTTQVIKHPGTLRYLLVVYTASGLLSARDLRHDLWLGIAAQR